MATIPNFSMAGRVALVTGASSGLGAGFAKLLAKAGAKVVVGARRMDSLAALVRDIAADGGEALAVSLDVADEASVIAAYDAAEARFGAVDTVIANAGINLAGTVVDLPMDQFDQMVSVNLRGVFLTVREGGKRMMAAGSAGSGNGRVVIISSLAAQVVSPGLAVYSGTKAGVAQMGKVIARDWIRKGINVNMIMPGFIRTELNDAWFATEAGKNQIAMMPRRRLMAQDQLDAMLLFLASDMSAGVTGSCFTLDDGQSLQG